MKSNTEWQKASASGADGQCVEMRRQDGWIQLRDSKNPAGAVLEFSPAVAAAWLDAARKGELGG